MDLRFVPVCARVSSLRGRALVAPALAGLFLATVVAACGGDVVVDDDNGSGGNGAAGPAGSGASGPAGPSGTGAAGAGPSGTTGPGAGPAGCTDHSACPPDSVCLFATGQCAKLCDGFCEGCGPGSICNGCATSSCPECADCIGACVPAQANQCDSDDACQPGQFCYFPDATCRWSCSPFEPSSCGPDEECVGCATGSCCGCDDCVDLCLPFFDG